MKTNPQSYLSTATLLMMATATGLCAGANYFNQPLLSSMASALNISEGLAAATVTLSQVTYAFGLLLLVPLGDKLEQRALAVGLMLLAAAWGALLLVPGAEAAFADRSALQTAVFGCVGACGGRVLGRQVLRPDRPN